ncbi:family 43 glycosylhydrolase [Mucilaginibacter sp. UR6-1]|uniref:family 43 glycosylhydrolase n=1 Tax=Mucilaginibacter sp. UR6-1 TaxID=1435643 RepID=UPI001E5A47DD|nr:family 43 glycosylhydrolase [Mucilaginibacter sp. UR6-1]MCC8408696.1 family 43 glycosylhydrolase [Mucilaginibacter sp. UR6-1]
MPRNACLLLIMMLFGYPLFAQPNAAQKPGNGNPIIPGYFADPTVKKFGDTYYIYATTDGNGGGHGPSQVWTSKDFVNWTMHDMNWPTTKFIWAPDVTLGNDGKYYMYYCQPVEIFGAWSNTPIGPWTPLNADNKPIVTNLMIPNVITLDGQTFRDDDGQFYMHWGTWGIYPNSGVGVGRLNADMKTFSALDKIPNTIAKDFFEAPFMFKRKGIYYLTYSSGYCENETYRVQYVMSNKGPMGPFTYGKNNPILTTNADGTVHGPGHQSVIEIKGEYYIVYHRHNNPHSGGGFHRQVCADKLVFDKDGNIEKVIPTHIGIGLLAKNTITAADLAYQKPVTASSYYSDDFKPEFALDNNNGTLWKSGDNQSPAWLQVDLCKTQTVKTILTQFEYPTWYYQYLIEYSADGKQWQTFADRTDNLQHGSPMVDKANVKARYIRITINNTEYPGLYKAIWNVKVYGADLDLPESDIAASAKQPDVQHHGLVVDLTADKLMPGEAVKQWTNHGKQGGNFTAGSNAPVADMVAGRKALVFTGIERLASDFEVPLSLTGNSSYTVSAWIYNPAIQPEEPYLTWTNGDYDLRNAIFGYGSSKDFGAVQHWGWGDIAYTNVPEAAKWHHMAVTFDGSVEKTFIDGKPDNSEGKMLFLRPAKNMLIGGLDDGRAGFSGAISALQVYDYALTDSAITVLASANKKENIGYYFDASKLNYGRLNMWVNEGASGGQFSGEDNTEIKDEAGRMTVSNIKNISINSSVPLQNYTLGMAIFAQINGVKGWHYLATAVNGNSTKTLLDGEEVNAGSLIIKNNGGYAIPSIIDINGKRVAVNSIAGLIIINETLGDSGLQSLTAAWQNKLKISSKAPMMDQAPTALSADMIAMQADTTVNSGRQYYFTETSGHAGGRSSGWTDEPYFVNDGLQPNTGYSYTLKTRDASGNISASTKAFNVNTSAKNFVTLHDDFNKPHSYLNTGTKGSIWDGIIGKGTQQTADKITVDTNGLLLSSTDSKWDGNKPNGPFLYKTLQGDFVAETQVTDVSGLTEKKVSGSNEAGLMVRLVADSSGKTDELVQNGIFTAWSVGNLVTNLQNGNRMQSNNQSGFNFYPYLQIQRSGSLFYLRGSNDGKHWNNLPGSPILRTDLDGKSLQIGLYQAIYGGRSAYGRFKYFKLVQPKTTTAR